MTTKHCEISCAGTSKTQEAAHDSRRLLHLWSSYQAPDPMQFRTPTYTADRCRAPRLRQGNFGDGSTPDIEKQVQLGEQQASSHAASPKCCSFLSAATYNGKDDTPGILRPEEHQNTHGRCHHHDDCCNKIIDTACAEKLGRQANLKDEHALQSAATLVAFPMSQAPLDKYGGPPGPSRHSISSESFYSTRSSGVEGENLSQIGLCGTTLGVAILTMMP